MDSKTRNQLLSLSTEFYRAHAADFDASRGHRPWPGWKCVNEWLPRSESTDRLDSTAVEPTLRTLDVGCGNARFASFLAGAGHRLDYTGVDANAELLAAAGERLDPNLTEQIELVELDFLSTASPGTSLPGGPFDLIALFGVLHHVPSRDWRRDFLRELAERLATSGVLAIAAWQFGGRPRFKRRTVEWEAFNARGGALGAPIDLAQLEPGDALLRFGSDPERPPRYCHQVADPEFESIAEDVARNGIDLEILADFRADGANGDLNRYAIFRRQP